MGNTVLQQKISGRRYHHGDLRRAILDAAGQWLNDEGNANFTLREIARRVGVSHTAPYKHFPDKDALLGALAKMGFDQLQAALGQAQSAAGQNSHDALMLMARAYLDFGTHNAALYRLMFRARVEPCDADGRAEADSLLDAVRDTLVWGRTDGAPRERPVRDHATAYWSLLHGMTLLSIDGLISPGATGLDPLAGAFRTILEGIAQPV